MASNNSKDKQIKSIGIIAVVVLVLVVLLFVTFCRGKKEAAATTAPAVATAPVKEEPAPVKIETSSEKVEATPAVVEKAPVVTEPVQVEEVVVKTEPAKEAALPAVVTSEETKPSKALGPVFSVVQTIIEDDLTEPFSFSVFGFGVEGKYSDGWLNAFSSKKGLLSASDIHGFANYEANKYGEYLTCNVKYSVVDDGIALSFPDSVDAGLYLDQFQADIAEYVEKLLATKTEVVEVPVASAPVEDPAVLFHDVYAYAGYHAEVTATANSAIITCDAPITPGDIKAVASLLVNAYPEASFCSYEVIADGKMVISYPSCDADYLAAVAKQLQGDALWYLSKLFETVEASPAPVEEEAKAYSFSVFGYGIEGEYADGYFDSFSSRKGILTADDILGFIGYEVAKYGEALTANVKYTLVDDGFVLAIPAGVDAGAYIIQYQSDVLEYLNVVFAPKVEEAVVTAVEEPVLPEPVVETPVVVEPIAEEPAVETPVVEEPAPTPVAVPGKIDAVEVMVVTDGSAKPEVASPVAEKIVYNQFKVALTIKGGAYAVAEKSLENYAFMGGLSLDFKNAMTFGTRVGFGARLNASATAYNMAGTKTVLSSPLTYFKSTSGWNTEIAGSADLMFYANFNRATMYAGAGAGYCVTRNLNPIVSGNINAFGHALKGGLFVEGVTGMSIALSEKIAMGFDLGYRYYTSTDKSSVNGGLALTFNF